MNLGIKDKDFDQFMELAAQTRMDLYRGVIATSQPKIKLAANALRLEDMVLETSKMRFAKVVADLLFDPRNNLVKGSPIEELVLELQQLQIKSGPVKTLTESYGIPLVGEVELYTDEEKAQRAQQLFSKTQELEVYLKDYLAHDLEEMSETAKNRMELIKVISGK